MPRMLPAKSADIVGAMTEQVRATASAITLACTLVACHPGAGPVDEAIVEPGAITELEADAGAQAITPVLQLTPIAIDEWRFEPGARRFSSTEFGDCSIFDVESGRLIQSVTQEQELAAPCNEWLPGDYLFSAPDVSTDGRLQLDRSMGLEILDAETGKQLRVLPCPDCMTSSAITWARTGHEIAVAWTEPLHLEIWDADTGQLVRAEQIPTDGDVDQLELGWTEGGATMMWTELGFPVECAGYEYDCIYDEVDQVSRRRSVERQVLLLGATSKSVIPLGEQAGFDYVRFDPEGRWVFWRYDWSEGREGMTTELHFEGLAGQGSGIGWQLADGYEGYNDEMTREGTWRSDGATHWAVSATHTNGDTGINTVGWETTITSPGVGHRTGVVVENLEWGAEVSVEVFGFAGDALLMSGEACIEGSCTPIGIEVGAGCELLDVASGHASELLDCGGELFLRNAGGTKRLPHDPATLSWWWSRGGALVLADGTTFTVLDAVSGVGGLQRSDPLTVFEGRLGLELERLVLMSDLGLEVVDLRAGKVLAKFPDVFPDDVALSPTGDRVALLVDGQVRVHSLPSGEPLASWPVLALELAFRQDGKVIFAGAGMPEQVFDAATGMPLDVTMLDPLFEAIGAGGEIDPSWRWIMNDETQELVRTLDGLMLRWMGSSAFLPSTGQYDQAGPGPEIAYRVGGDPSTVPEFDAADLNKWLQRGDLAELFLAGQVIAKPTITAGELANVRAAREAKQTK
jgi:hypothetical protein